MSPILSPIVQTVSDSFVGHSAAPLLTVAAFMAASLALYGVTRGKEFLIAGYSAVLFLVPFVHFS